MLALKRLPEKHTLIKLAAKTNKRTQILIQTRRGKRQGGTNNNKCNMHKNLVKLGHVIFELCERTDRQTDKQTNKHPSLGWSNIYATNLNWSLIISAATPESWRDSSISSSPNLLSLLFAPAAVIIHSFSASLPPFLKSRSILHWSEQNLTANEELVHLWSYTSNPTTNLAQKFEGTSPNTLGPADSTELKETHLMCPVGWLRLLARWSWFYY